MTTPCVLTCREADCPNNRVSGSLYCRWHRDRIVRAKAAAKKAAKKAKKAAKKVAKKVAR